MNGNFYYNCQLLPNLAKRSKAMQEKLLSVQQIANYLKIDKFTVYRLVAQKEMPAFKVGSQWRFKKALIDAWLMRNSNVQQK